MKQIKTLLAALFVAMAGTASAQTKNYVHITKTDNSKIELSQDDIQSMIIDTEAPEEHEFVTFTDGTNTVTVAKMNLGATSVADGTSCYGDYYAWGATEPFGTVDQSAGTVNAKYAGGYSQDNAPYWNGSAYTKYTDTSYATITLDDGDDVVKVKKPGYHMPTLAEMRTLYAACGGTGDYMEPSSISSGAAYEQGIYWVEGATSAVTIGGDEYKANGMLFVQDADTHVFFPAAGFVGTTLSSAGYNGYYWSSSLRTTLFITVSTNYADSLYFLSDHVRPGDFDSRYFGFPVRPFKD
ncbi:MAG: hypothetical protein J6W24_02395 [Prevotella sp.]|nr:hypothetical protein [Prevotella sp.]